MTRADVQRWLDRYVAAWKSYDAAEIADLFSAEAEYRYHPWDEPGPRPRGDRRRLDRARTATPRRRTPRARTTPRTRPGRSMATGPSPSARPTTSPTRRGRRAIGATTTSTSSSSTPTVAAGASRRTTVKDRTLDARAEPRRVTTRRPAAAGGAGAAGAGVNRALTRAAILEVDGPHDPRRRRRADPPRDPRRGARRRRLPGRRGGRRPGGARPVPGRGAGPRPARPHAARAVRDRGLPDHPRGVGRPDRDAHGPRLRGRQDRRPRARGGRLRHEAVQPARADGPDPGDLPARRAGGGRRRPDASSTSATSRSTSPGTGS